MGKTFLEMLTEWIEVGNRRGHASMFARETPAQLRIVELETAREWARSMTASGLTINGVVSHEVANGRPDCWANLNGRRISIELTELVSRAALDEFTARGYVNNDHNIWTKDRLHTELSKRISAKEARYEKLGDTADALVVHSDEWIGNDEAADWLADFSPPASSSFHSAWLLLTQSDGALTRNSSWPCFKLFGTLE